MRTATHAEEQRSEGTELPGRDAIAVQLRRILSSPVFHGSKRCQQFLEYVCDKSLAGDTGSLKERSIAIDVFGRDPEADWHGEDTIVRVGAREVRKRLAQYYVTPDGAASTVLIELPPGSYAPDFRYAARPLEPLAAVMTPPIITSPVVVTEAAPELAAPKNLRRYYLGAGVVMLLAVLGIGVWSYVSADPRVAAFQRFWAPVNRSSEPLLIGVGHPLVYQPSHRASSLSAERLPPTPFPVQRALNLAPQEMNGSDMVPVFNQYIGFGDMVAANEVSQMLAHRSRNVRIMLASSIPFEELRQTPVYLIGSVSNRWTMELGQNWRFRFDWSKDHQPEFVDTFPNSKREWTIPAQDDGSTSDDYTMICRIRNSPTGNLIVVSAGLKQFGTEAAGRILADPAALGGILNRLPAGWEEKNLQVVLHMRVIGNAPAQPELVASYVW